MDNKKILMKSLMRVGLISGTIALVFIIISSYFVAFAITRIYTSHLFDNITGFVGILLYVVSIPFELFDCSPSSSPNLCSLWSIANFIVGFLVYVLLGMLVSFFILKYKKGKISKRKS